MIKRSVFFLLATVVFLATVTGRPSTPAKRWVTVAEAGTISIPFPGPGTPASSGGTWTNIASNSLSAGDTTGWANSTHVQYIPQASLAATGGTQVRITLKPPAATGSTITGIYIGQCSASFSATSPAFAATPVQILYGGSGSKTLTAGGANQLSDAASFVMPSSNGLCIAWQFTTSSNMPYSAVGSPSGWGISYKSGADAATVAKVSYTNYAAFNGSWLVTLVEELI